MNVGIIRSVYRSIRKVTGLTEKQMLTPYYWIPYHLYGSGKAWRPLFVTLELTYLCNLRCQMCSLVVGEMVTKAGQKTNPDLMNGDGNLRREVNTAEYLHLVEEMTAGGVKAVQITGGEPLLRKDTLVIAEAIKKKGMHLSLIHNGWARPDVYGELVRIGLDSITVSVDGTRAVHDKVRGVKGSFDHTHEAIEHLLREKKIQGKSSPKITVSCAISALNQHDITNLVDLFEDSEVDDMNLGYLHFSTAKRNEKTEAKMNGQDQILHLKNPELPDPVLHVDTQALAQRIARIKAEKGKRKLPITFSPDLSAEEIKLQYTDEWFTFSNKCFYAWYATRIDPWGQMYPCWIDIRLGDVREHTFMELWNGQGYRGFRRLIRKEKLVPKCTTCCVLNDRYWSKLPTFRR
ncbi:MAG: radical SAM protein [Acidobacteriota bacterium]